MIVGNGLIAKTFETYKEDMNLIIFASGVSNSVDPSCNDFNREEKLLKLTMQNNLQKTIVYFSSCDISNNSLNNKLYYIHKKNMEDLVKLHNSYFIFRLPQVIGCGGNEKTLINFLIYKIKHQENFTIFVDTYKSLIDIDDVYSMCKYIIENKLFISKIIDIANPYYMSIEEITRNIEKFLNKRAIYNTKHLSSYPNYDIKISKSISQKLHIDFKLNYLPKLLDKYYESEI